MITQELPCSNPACSKRSTNNKRKALFWWNLSSLQSYALQSDHTQILWSFLAKTELCMNGTLSKNPNPSVFSGPLVLGKSPLVSITVQKASTCQSPPKSEPSTFMKLKLEHGSLRHSWLLKFKSPGRPSTCKLSHLTVGIWPLWMKTLEWLCSFWVKNLKAPTSRPIGPSQEKCESITRQSDQSLSANQSTNEEKFVCVCFQSLKTWNWQNTMSFHWKRTTKTKQSTTAWS